MTANWMILLLAATPDPVGAAPPICEMTYVAASGQREVAVRVNADGSATAMLRGERRTVRLGRQTAARLRERFLEYEVCACHQQDFDARITQAARRAGLQLPLPYAEMCEITLPGGQLACAGAAILATRLPDETLVQQFERVRRDLEQVRAVVILGGPAAVSRFLTTGEQALGQELSLSTLVYADDFAGERVAHFRPAGVHGPLLVVSAQGDQRPVARVFEMAGP